MLRADQADRAFHPDEEEGRREGGTDTGAIGGIARHPDRKLEAETDTADQKGRGDEIECGPAHFIGELHCDQRQQKERRGGAPRRDPRSIPAPSAALFRPPSSLSRPLRP
ncbi:MAG TPA: hypothetical protein VGF77_01155 [Allosphingosinicella sp.]